LTISGIYLTGRFYRDFLIIKEYPHNLQFKSNAIWNKYNPFYYYYGVICNSYIINDEIYYNGDINHSLSSFSNSVPRFCVTPQLIYLLLNKGANCTDLIYKMYNIYKTDFFWKKCMDIDPTIYPFLPVDYRIQYTDLYNSSFKVGSNYDINSIPGSKRRNPALYQIILNRGLFKKEDFNQETKYIFGEFEISINKDNLNEFWMDLLKSDHNNRCLFPHAPKEVQDKVLKEIKTYKLHQLKGFVLSGEQFNMLDVSKETLVKNINVDNIHYNLELKLGLNIDPLIFNPYCECCKGGIYATNSEHQHYWHTDRTDKVYKVEVPNDPNVKVKIESKNKFKATEIILKND